MLLAGNLELFSLSVLTPPVATGPPFCSPPKELPQKVFLATGTWEAMCS